MPTVKRVFEGLTVVAVGVILLANTTGVLPWNVWLTIFSLWPLLVVSAGLDILGKATNNSALRVLASLVVIGGLAWGAAAGAGRVQAPVFAVPGGRSEAFSFSEPHVTASAGRASVSAGATRVTLKGGAQFATAEGRSPFGKPSFKVRTSGETARVDIGSADGSTVGPVGGAGSFLDVTLDRELPWEDLKVDAGASEIRLDLSALRVRRLQADVGMSGAVITFGALEPQAEAVVNGGMSSVTVRVPGDLGVEVRAQNGLGSVVVPTGWTRVSGNSPFEGTWRSDGYDSSASKLLLEVKTGMSSVKVERY